MTSATTPTRRPVSKEPITSPSSATPRTTAPSAVNWGDEQRLTTSSFNILDAPVARGHFLGDYMGLAASGMTTVVPVFGVATAPNMTVEYTRVISGLP